MITAHSFPEICPLGLSQGPVASCLNVSHIFPSDSLNSESAPSTCSPHPYPCLPWGAFDQKMKRQDQSCACEQEAEAR